MSAEVKSMKEWALYYAELGLAVFPLAYRNKVPAIEGGCKAATTEKSKIERWWNQNPRYNIGIATGNKSNGLVVIDLDVDKNKGIDGYEVLRDWQNKHGELPETWQSITGRGGYHYFYKDTITHSNKVGLYEGVDIRGEGGYIVAPPSVHPNGNTYEWEQEPKEYEIAQVDDIVNDFFKGEKQRIDSEHKTNFKVPELIPEGKRVDTIVRLIASLRTKGLDDDAIKAAVRVENEKRCNPPLKEKELEKAVFPALKRDWQVNSPYYNNFNAMNENDNKYVNEVLKKLNELNAVERFPMNDRGSADLFATIFKNVSRYNPTKKDWMYYDKTRWTADTEGMRAKRNAKMLADVLVRYSVTASLPDDKRQSYEITALKWQDIDYINNVIRVNKTVSWKEGGGIEETLPKSDTSNRDIPMNDTIKKILQMQKTKMSMVYGEIHARKMDSNIFIGSNGAKAIASSTVSSAIDNVLKRLRQQDIEIERFTHHAFRDTFATRYIEEGGNMQTLQKILGHSSLAMTADLYAHVLPNTKQQEMQQIENGFIGVAVL